MQPKTSQGRGIRCGSCGGTFPLATLASAVLCPYCGARQDLNSTTFVEVRQYRAEVFEHMQRADAERQHAAAWSGWESGMGGRGAQIAIAASVLFMVVPACVSIPTFLLHAGGHALPGGVEQVFGLAAGACGPVVMIGVVAAVLVAQLRMRGGARMGGAARSAAGAAPSKVACPHCGAPNPLAVGQAVQTCAHCRGALMPSKTVMIAGLDAARMVRRHAALERHRAERSGMARVHATTSTYQKWLPLFYVFPFLPGVLAVFVMPMIALGERASLAGKVAMGLGAGLVLGALGGGAVFFAYRSWQRRRAWRETLGDLATQFHGRVSTDVADLVGWLNAAWAGPYDLRHIAGGPRFSFVTLDAWGYRAALALSPQKGRLYQAHHPTYARLLLAAWIPGRSEGGKPPKPDARAQATLDWLAAAGFSVLIEEAVLLAVAQPAVVEHLRRTPESAHQLAPVVGHLVRLAHELGAQPVHG